MDLQKAWSKDRAFVFYKSNRDLYAHVQSGCIRFRTL